MRGTFDHAAPLDHRPLIERVEERIIRSDGCWEWTGPRNRDGYGHFSYQVDPGNRRRRTSMAHRLIYEHYVGPIPPGLTLDHMCRNRGCVNPLHLRPMTLRANVLLGTSPVARHSQQTHCIHGHEFTPENTYWRPRGAGRDCRTCIRRRIEARRAALRSRGRLQSSDAPNGAQRRVPA